MRTASSPIFWLCSAGLGALVAMTACGDDEASGTTGAGGGAGSASSSADASSAASSGAQGGGGAAGCAEIVDLTADNAHLDNVYILSFDVDVDFGAREITDTLSIGIWSDDVGTFDLGREQNLAQADHAVLLTVDVDDFSTLTGADYYFQQSGSMTLEVAHDSDLAFGYAVKGTLTDVVLQPVALSPTNETTPIAGETCYRIASLAFDGTGAAVDCGAPTDLVPPSGGKCGAGLGDCNPVTNAPCEASEQCELNGLVGEYQCFPAGDAELCGACTNSVEPFCQAGMTCSSLGNGEGECHRYCCEDIDCGEGGSCVLVYGIPTLGVCLVDP
jgi:hypothetical protein